MNNSMVGEVLRNHNLNSAHALFDLMASANTERSDYFSTFEWFTIRKPLLRATAFSLTHRHLGYPRLPYEHISSPCHGHKVAHGREQLYVALWAYSRE